MLPIMIIVGAILGLLVGAGWPMSGIIGEVSWLAMMGGGALGGLLAMVLRQGQRIEALERQLQQADQAAHQVRSAVKQDAEPAPPQSEPAAATDTFTAEAGERMSASSPSPTAPPQHRSEPKLTEATPPWSGWERLHGWFRRGNVPVKIGALVSLIGIAALLRYAADQGWLFVPIELRLSGVALFAIVMLAIGWRQRDQRRVFALAIQGFAIGVLLLTVFSAFRFYDLLPASAAFALMVALIFSAGVLAVVQQALALAVLALLSGFAAPLLIGDPGGSPVILFSWYAVLNLAVFGVAWWQSWPVLNRLGFGFTFVIGTLWGTLAWSPAHFGSAQFFLILFSALYFLIPIIQALRNQAEAKPRLDVILVFGLPLFAFPLQIALLLHDPMAVALAALAAAVVYLASAVLLLRRWKIRSLGQAHAVLALGLATLAVPFAFSGPTLTLIWALEGAALVWFGCLQQRRLTRLAGIALQLAAACVWLIALVFAFGRPGTPVFNELTMGGLALAVAALISAWRYDLAGAKPWRVNLFLAGALLFWVISISRELQIQFVPVTQSATLIAMWALTGLIGALIWQRKQWWLAGLTAVGGPAICGLLVFHQIDVGGLLSNASLISWLFVAACVVAIDRLVRLDTSGWRAAAGLAGHAAVLIFLCALGTQLATEVYRLAAGWQWLAGAAPLLALTAWLVGGLKPPLAWQQVSASHHRGLTGAALLALIVGLLASVASAASPAPLPWLPLLNPLELAQLIGLLMLVAVALRLSSQSSSQATSRLPEIPLALPALLGLLLTSAMALRSVHHLAGIEWDLLILLDSALSQASLSILWTCFGVVAWVVGSRTHRSTLWWAGAVLLGIVLIKLVLIDRQFLSTVAGILSFLAFGILSILVGYLAPAPPKSDPTEAKA